MRGVFDEEDEQERLRHRRDTELTLGTGMLLAIFVGLVLLCGLCFGMGYAVGHRSSGPSAIAAPQPAPDQEPLQASGTIPKPSAIAQTPVTPPDQPAADPPPGDAGAPPAQTATPEPVAPVPAQPASQPQVHPALPPGTVAQPSSGSAQPQVQPALPTPPLMVQVAAVSNPEDAQVLVNALRQRSYPVTARRGPGDDYIHVRVGPFATRAIAEQWKAKLLNDGYNAVVLP